MSSARGLILFRDSGGEEAYVYNHWDGNPVWVIPDLARANRAAHAPKAGCFGDPWTPGLSTIVHAKGQAAYLIAENPDSYQPVPNSRIADLDFSYIVTLCRERQSGTLPWDVYVCNASGMIHRQQPVTNLLKKYPDLGKRVLGPVGIDLYVVDEWWAKAGGGVPLYYTGFDDNDAAIRCARTRQRERGGPVTVYRDGRIIKSFRKLKAQAS